MCLFLCPLRPLIRLILLQSLCSLNCLSGGFSHPGQKQLVGDRVYLADIQFQSTVRHCGEVKAGTRAASYVTVEVKSRERMTSSLRSTCLVPRLLCSYNVGGPDPEVVPASHTPSGSPYQLKQSKWSPNDVLQANLMETIPHYGCLPE